MSEMKAMFDWNGLFAEKSKFERMTEKFVSAESSFEISLMFSLVITYL
jgi:hypothetical protein